MVVAVVEVVDLGAVVVVLLDVVDVGSVVVVDDEVVVEVDGSVDVVSSVEESTEVGASELAAPCNNCGGGSGKASGGTSVSASDMNACQIFAGRVPPLTLTPCTLSIGRLPSG